MKKERRDFVFVKTNGIGVNFNLDQFFQRFKIVIIQEMKDLAMKTNFTSQESEV